MFVLVDRNCRGDFYIGKTYTLQGEYYACVGSIEEAKKYTSKKRAENACEKLNQKVYSKFEVKEC